MAKITKTILFVTGCQIGAALIGQKVESIGYEFVL